jgi:hypothetical protein
MKRIISVIIAAVLLLSVMLSLGSCGKYVSSYKALGLIRSQTSHSCEARFSSLTGELVFKIKKTDVGTEGAIKYSITAEEGEIRLYYDIFGIKEHLATVKAGETVEDSGGYVEGGYQVYIIIEAEEKSRGSVSVELDN